MVVVVLEVVEDVVLEDVVEVVLELLEELVVPVSTLRNCYTSKYVETMESLGL